MQPWFLFALLAPLLWSIINHIDKYLLSKYKHGEGVGTLIVFSSLVAILVLPFTAYFYADRIFHTEISKLILLIFVGFSNAVAIYCYLRAMNIEEASIVVILLQMSAIFAFILGLVFLGEKLNVQQILASLLIIVGVIIISIEIDIENKYKFKKKAFFWILLSSFMFALHDVAFKLVTTEDTFWVSSFWQYAGLSLFGIILILFSPFHRKEFFLTLKGKKTDILKLNILNEIIYILGNLANNFATLLAPVAIVLVISSYEPLFVFLEAILLTIFFPKFIIEKISLKHLAHKMISIAVIIIGSYFLYTSSNF